MMTKYFFDEDGNKFKAKVFESEDGKSYAGFLHKEERKVDQMIDISKLTNGIEVLVEKKTYRGDTPF